MPIVVCVLNNTQSIPSRLFRKRSEVQFRLIDVIYPEQYEGINTTQIGDIVYEKMNTALKNLRFDTMTHPDFFTSPDFIGKIETQWETYYLPGERLMRFLTGEALDKEVQVKYFITLYQNFYEIKGVYQIIARDWANPLDKNYTKKEIPLERDSEYWSLIENFAASLQKELVKN